jgi:hypothetical protein
MVPISSGPPQLDRQTLARLSITGILLASASLIFVISPRNFNVSMSQPTRVVFLCGVMFWIFIYKRLSRCDPWSRRFIIVFFLFSLPHHLTTAFSSIRAHSYLNSHASDIVQRCLTFTQFGFKSALASYLLKPSVRPLFEVKPPSLRRQVLASMIIVTLGVLTDSGHRWSSANRSFGAKRTEATEPR